jgi:hypothetical protein
MLPPEADSAGVTRFAFLAYGDTRGQVDGQELQSEHAAVVEQMLGAIRTGPLRGFPVRFVVQSGDTVTAFKTHQGGDPPPARSRA